VKQGIEALVGREWSKGMGEVYKKEGRGHFLMENEVTLIIDKMAQTGDAAMDFEMRDDFVYQTMNRSREACWYWNPLWSMPKSWLTREQVKTEKK
jgi:hypothetical protein